LRTRQVGRNGHTAGAGRRTDMGPAAVDVELPPGPGSDGDRGVTRRVRHTSDLKESSFRPHDRFSVAAKNIP